jgi:hypothetical protein
MPDIGIKDVAVFANLLPGGLGIAEGACRYRELGVIPYNDLQDIAGADQVFLVADGELFGKLTHLALALYFQLIEEIHRERLHTNNLAFRKFRGLGHGHAGRDGAALHEHRRCNHHPRCEPYPH